MRVAVALLLLAAGAVPSGAETPPADYAAAVAKLETGDAAGAARELRRLIEAAPRESAGPPPYLPHFYLGLAHRRMNDCLLALREWRTSLEQGAIRGLPEQQRLDQERAGCEAQLVTPQIDTARRAVAGAGDLLALAENVGADPELKRLFAAGTPLGARLESGRQKVRAARARLELAERERDLGAAFEAQEAAAEAERALAGLAEEALAAARSTPAPRGAPTPAPERTATAAPAAAADGVAAALRRAAPLYFAGDYAGAERELLGIDAVGAAGEPARARAGALLLRAAARLGRLRAGDGEGALLDAARGDAVSARRLDATLAPAPELFPPSLRALWLGGK